MAQCESCGFVFTSEPVPDTGLRYNDNWFENEYLPSFGIDPKAPNTTHLAPRFDKDLELLEQHTTKGSLLDVGAGAGLLLDRAKQRGWSVTGVEPAGYGVEFAKKHFGIEIHKDYLHPGLFPAESFDAVILQDVLEHVPEPREVLAQVRRVLKPSGVVLITTPNYGSLSRFVYRSNWSLISPAEHLSLFRLGNLKRALVESGLAPVVLTTTPEISRVRFHFPQQPYLRVRKAILSLFSGLIPEGVTTSAGIGDEIVCISTR